MKPNRMTLSQQIEHYQKLLGISKDSIDVMSRQNQNQRDIIAAQHSDIEWYRKIITKLVEK